MTMRTYKLRPGASWLTATRDRFTLHRDGSWTRVVTSPDGLSVTFIYGGGE
jgi:hypothetical protein